MAEDWQRPDHARLETPCEQSSPTRASQSQNHSQIRHMLRPTTLTKGDIDCEFDYDSSEAALRAHWCQMIDELGSHQSFDAHPAKLND